MTRYKDVYSRQWISESEFPPSNNYQMLKPGHKLIARERYAIADLLIRGGYAELVTTLPSGDEVIPDWVATLFTEAGEREFYKAIMELMKVPVAERDAYIDMYLLKFTMKRENK
jgi:hypothetical protein